MGVTGLWTVVAPTARPTQLATLNRKRLAVDASIWIYQFLKAVRDKEGNALRNSHVVGFFRRICKLLYFGIKPVFVFDGGAPLLKRETIRSRARRREGRREDAARTAGKLLAVQVARAAEEEEKRRRTARERTPVEELPADEELVYVDEIGLTKKERQAGRGFKKKDQYHLPDLDVSVENMGAPNDPRIMSQAELEEYARHFHSGEDINIYDFSKIDFESPFFLSLPPGDRYNILNAARLRSRLRMGYSKEQLDGMFPDRMAFSRFQIERVKERNELTQRLMHVNGMAEDFLNQGGRIAGEKGKEYVLVKNDGVEGGWALGVVSNKKGAQKETAIDLDKEERSDIDSSSSAEDEDFEDVEIEGLNRIPKVWQRKRKEVDYDTNYENAAEEIARKRKAVYEARAQNVASQKKPRIETRPVQNDEDNLFVPHDIAESDQDMDELFEDVDLTHNNGESDDDDLQLAIAMSLEKDYQSNEVDAGGFVPSFDSNDQDDGVDFQSALAESRRMKSLGGSHSSPSKDRDLAINGGFDGPLPFESLNLGQSLLGKKKAKKMDEDLSGGFDRNLGDDTFRKERPAQPMPSWFNAVPKLTDLRYQNENTVDEVEPDRAFKKDHPDKTHKLRRNSTKEVIDLEAEETRRVIHIDDSDIGDSEFLEELEPQDTLDDAAVDTIPQLSTQELEERKEEERGRDERYRLAQQIADENKEPVDKQEAILSQQISSPSADGGVRTDQKNTPSGVGVIRDDESKSNSVEWSESDLDTDTEIRFNRNKPANNFSEIDSIPAINSMEVVGHESDGERSDVFEDVRILHSSDDRRQEEDDLAVYTADKSTIPTLIAADEPDEDVSIQTGNQEVLLEEEDDYYMSESEEELMRQLAIEVEEHARFASSLSNKTPAQAARDYETELKQLRNQQKKDRRDADEVTQTMVQECQALLRLFGLPYITAPMEAEAQCAELVHLGLVDGIVTDDSDVFLFGGTRVYKNMFNAAKFVECYLSADLEREYALDRRKLVRFAHLLGSDYTEGIPGVGPVTALEILTDFPTLEEFKEWCNKVQTGRTQDMENQLTTPFRRKFRNTVQKRIFLPPGFPDVRVDQAYLQPEVDSDPQEFQWGVPDLDKLRSFLMATIGWNQERTDEILVPVIRDMNKRELEGTQANITRFFSGGVGIGAAAKDVGGSRRTNAKESGRMANAYKRLRGEAERRRQGVDSGDAELVEDQHLSGDENAGMTLKANRPKDTGRKHAVRAKHGTAPPEEEDVGVDEGVEAELDLPPRKVTRKRKVRAA